MRKPVKTHLPAVSSPLEWATTADGILYTAQIPNREDGSIETGDIRAQAELTLSNLRRTVEAAGGSMDDVTQVLVYLPDRQRLSGHERDLRQVVQAALPEPRDHHRQPDGAGGQNRDRGLRPCRRTERGPRVRRATEGQGEEAGAGQAQRQTGAPPVRTAGGGAAASFATHGGHDVTLRRRIFFGAAASAEGDVGIADQSAAEATGDSAPAPFRTQWQHRIAWRCGDLLRYRRRAGIDGWSMPGTIRSPRWRRC